MLKLKNYNKPTPKKLKRLGDALLAISVIIVPVGLPQWINVAIFCTAVAGKFLTNFFAEDED